MIVGDHLLPKITPHVGVFPGGPTNPLADFLASQRKVQGFDVALVLPAHGGVVPRPPPPRQPDHPAPPLPHAGDARHRAARPRTAYEVASLAFGFDIDSPLTIQFPATFETLAHLEYLRATGKAERDQQGAEIVYRAVARS